MRHRDQQRHVDEQTRLKQEQMQGRHNYDMAEEDEDEEDPMDL